MENWKPGGVALIRIGGYPPEIGIHDSHGKWYVAGPRLGSQHGWYEDNIEIVRPLVVIDPEDLETVRKLAAWTADGDYAEWRIKWVQDFLRGLANPTPPKPPEPQGLGAVVEDADGKRFVRYTDELTAPWRHVEPPCGARPYRYYADIAAVKVLSEGVPA